MTVKKWMAVVVTAGLMITGLLAMSGGAKTPLDQNKETVTSFYKLAFNDHKPAEAVEKYVGGSYRQHNPLVADGSRASDMTPRPRRWPSTTPCCDGSGAMGGPSSRWVSAVVNRRTRQRCSTGPRY